MEELPSPAEEKKLPSPEEKLLRQPTFWGKYAKFLGLILLLLLIIILISAVILINKTPKSAQAPQATAPTQPLPISLPTPTADPTTNWNIYKSEKWRFEFKYPADFKILEESDTRIVIAKDQLGSSGISVVSDKNDMYTNINSLKTCNVVLEEINKNSSGDRPECLDDGKKFGQSQDISVIKLGGVDVKSFYVTSTGAGGTTHVLQTINSPLIQITSSDPNETLFNQILSTFKFTQ